MGKAFDSYAIAGRMKGRLPILRSTPGQYEDAEDDFCPAKAAKEPCPLCNHSECKCEKGKP